MKCEYNIKFKRWEPIEFAIRGEKLITARDVYDIENKFKRNNRNNYNNNKRRLNDKKHFH